MANLVGVHPYTDCFFLEKYDFPVNPSCRSAVTGGGGLGQSQTAIAKLAPNANLAESLAINYSGGFWYADDGGMAGCQWNRETINY